MTLSAFAAERRRRPAAIDLYLMLAMRSEASQPHAAAAVERRDRQTEQTNGPTHAYYADSVNNSSQTFTPNPNLQP